MEKVRNDKEWYDCMTVDELEQLKMVILIASISTIPAYIQGICNFISCDMLQCVKLCSHCERDHATLKIQYSSIF